MDEKRLSLRKGEEAAKLSTFILVALSVLKGIVAVFSGSVALLASTVDSVSDIFSSAAVWAGLNIAKKKPDEKFPYGYYKAETFALLIVSFIIVVSSILILLESFPKFSDATVLLFSDWALATAALSVIVYYLLAKYKERVGRQISSQALVSEGLNSMVDVYTSALVFSGIFLATFGYHVVEPLVGIAIGIYVLIRGFLYGKDAALVLMDISPSPQRVKEMKEIAEAVNGVEGTHEVRLRKSGPVFFGEMHLELHGGLSLEKAHEISDEVEKKIRERFKDLEAFTVHAGLAHRKKPKIAIPLSEDKGLESAVSLHFGSAPYFVFLEAEKGQILDYYVRENKGAKLSHRKGIEAVHLLVQEKADVVVALSIGEGPFYVLRDNLVQIYYLPNSIGIRDAVRRLDENSLQRVTSPTAKHEEKID